MLACASTSWPEAFAVTVLIVAVFGFLAFLAWVDR